MPDPVILPTNLPPAKADAPKISLTQEQIDAIANTLPSWLKPWVPLVIALLPLLFGAGWLGAVMTRQAPQDLTAVHARIDKIADKVKPAEVPKAPLAITAKAGELVVVDGSFAKGDVLFDYDQVAFDQNHAAVEGKKLYLVSPRVEVDKVFAVSMISWDDKVRVVVNITVQTDMKPRPPQPPPVDPLADLRADIDAVQAGLKAYIARADAAAARVDARLAELEKIKPQPPPIPPKPPDPPQPPAPIPLAGFRVMVIYESEAALPSKQQAILTGKEVRDYLNSKCIPTPDGAKRGWYITDKDADFSGESKTWQDAVKRPRTTLPWVIVSNGVAGFEGPLPEDVSAMMALLRKYGEK